MGTPLDSNWLKNNGFKHSQIGEKMNVNRDDLVDIARDLETHERKNIERSHGSARESRKNLERIVDRLLALADLERKKPTVADTGWKPEYEYMWAVYSGSSGDQNVLMTRESILDNDDVIILLAKGNSIHVGAGRLTPLGIKADLDFKNPSPRKLETVEQMNAAPAGTLVIDRDGDRWTKQRYGQWNGCPPGHQWGACPPGHVIEFAPLLVNRWGNGES